jgi:hypothetical protein
MSDNPTVIISNCCSSPIMFLTNEIKNNMPGRSLLLNEIVYTYDLNRVAASGYKEAS